VVTAPGRPGARGTLAGRPAGIVHRVDIARVLTVLAGPGTQPALLTATGDPASIQVVVAVLLELLGVPRRSVVEASCGRAGRGSVAPTDVRAVLNDIDAAGGIHTWWASTGHSGWPIEALRATLLDAEPSAAVLHLHGVPVSPRARGRGAESPLVRRDPDDQCQAVLPVARGSAVRRPLCDPGSGRPSVARDDASRDRPARRPAP
jgi:hypothetical protein